MSKRDEFKALMEINKRAVPNIDNEARNGYLKVAKDDYGLTPEEAEKILKEVGITVGPSVNYFEVLGLSIDELKNLSETEVKKRVRDAYEPLFRSLRNSNNPRKRKQLDEVIEAKKVLIEEGKWQQHLQETLGEDFDDDNGNTEEEVVPDVNTKDTDGDTRLPSLHFAAREGFYKVAQMSLNHGADPNAKDTDDNTPLHLATREAWYNKRERCRKVAQMLLNHGADPNAKDTDDNTPLHLATRINDDKQVEMLLNHGAAVNAKNEDGNTPLHEAAKWKNAAKTTEILLKNGADPNAKDIDGKTPLHIAAANCSYIMGQLLSNGAKVLAKDEYGKTPLMAAGDLYTFRKLFESTWFSKLLGKLGWAAWAAFLCLIITIGFFDDRFDSVYFLYVAWGFGSLSVLLLIIIGMICMAKKEYEKIWKARKNWRKN